MKWNERYRSGYGSSELNARLVRHLARLRTGRVLDLAGGVGANARLFAGSDYVVADIAEEALSRASGLRVQADAGALPFAPGTFDTVLCLRFFYPALDLGSLLAPGGTLFFETMTAADKKYRPSFNPAFYFDPARANAAFAGLEILMLEEGDDGRMAFATVIARKTE